jgi:hypothetical protein
VTSPDEPTSIESVQDRPGDGAGTLPNPSSKRAWISQFGHSAAMGWRQRHQFDDVERFCFFIGYPRSGHSLVGSLLNAHREIVISHELDAVGHARHHFGRSQIYSLIVERDEYFASMGRRWMGYDYVVPNQFQGRSTRLRVIGDKRARTATYWLGQRPHLLDHLRTVVGVPIRVIHITRNPYDNIATMARRTSAARRQGAPKDAPANPLASLDETIDRYDQLCRWVSAVRPHLGTDELYELEYETFVSDPRGSLEALCRFLDVEAGESYLTDCAGIVWPSTRRTRDKVNWSDEERTRVESLMATYPALAGYAGRP